MIVGDTIRMEHLAADVLLLARLDAVEQPRPDRIDLTTLVGVELARPHQQATSTPFDRTRNGPHREVALRSDGPGSSFDGGGYQGGFEVSSVCTHHQPYRGGLGGQFGERTGNA